MEKNYLLFFPAFSFNMTKTEIYLQKKLKVLLPEKNNCNSKILVATILKNIESLGYIFSRKLTNHLCTLSENELESFYKDIVPILKQIRGAHRKFNPIYPNFPKQVMEMDSLDLYVNAIIHYWSATLQDLGVVGETWLPEYKKEERLPLNEKITYDVIDLGDESDFTSIFTTLVAAKSSISESDKQIVEWFIKSYKDKIVKFLPTTIGTKEGLTFLISKLLTFTSKADSVSSLIKTATDVLRIATGLSDGDISLAENTKFKKFSRKERRLLLTYLENANNIEEDMVRYRNRWVRLGEILHPREWKSRFPKANKAFLKLRENKKIETFNSKVESAIINGTTARIIRLLSQRPGDFARRLDHIFRNNLTTKTKVADAFLKVAHQVSTPVLLQVANHFKHRHKNKEFRSVFPKGMVGKMQVIDNNLKQISENFCTQFSEKIERVLAKRFKALDSLGAVYLDDKLKNYIVPFSQRSAAKALKTIVRGSKIDLETDKDTIRFFIWWKNMNTKNEFENGYWDLGCVDIDLSATILDENWNCIADISYYNLKDCGGCHSGDITNAPNGAAEFIDISKEKILAYGGRYIVMCINSYTQQPYCDLPECFAGWMTRSKPESGEIFEPRTVKNKIDISSNTSACIPLIIDVVENKVIWVDISFKNRPSFANNVKNNTKSIGLICKGIANLNKPNLYDLLKIHAKSRGKLTKIKAKADTVFSEQDGITPFHIDKIMAEYL